MSAPDRPAVGIQAAHVRDPEPGTASYHPIPGARGGERCGE